jgi:hypothetical protein
MVVENLPTGVAHVDRLETMSIVLAVAEGRAASMRRRGAF